MVTTAFLILFEFGCASRKVAVVHSDSHSGLSSQTSTAPTDTFSDSELYPKSDSTADLDLVIEVVEKRVLRLNAHDAAILNTVLRAIRSGNQEILAGAIVLKLTDKISDPTKHFWYLMLVTARWLTTLPTCKQRMMWWRNDAHDLTASEHVLIKMAVYFLHRRFAEVYECSDKLYAVKDF